MVDAAVKLELQFRQLAAAQKKCNLAGANALLKDLRALDREIEADEKAIRKALILAIEDGAEGKKFVEFEKNRHVAPALKALEGRLKTLAAAIKELQDYCHNAKHLHADLSRLLVQVDKEVKAQGQALAKVAKTSPTFKTQSKALDGLEKFRENLNADCNEMDRAADVELLIDKYLLVYDQQKDKVLKKLLEEANNKAKKFELDPGLTEIALTKLGRVVADLVKRTQKTVKNAQTAAPGSDGAKSQLSIAKGAVDDLLKHAEELRDLFDAQKAAIKDDILRAAIEKKVKDIERIAEANQKHYKTEKAKVSAAP